MADVGEANVKTFRKDGSGVEVIQLAIRLTLLALLIYWSYIIVRPFVPILAWGIVLAVALYPAYNWLSAHLGQRPRWAAVIMTLVILAVFLGPATWLGLGLVEGLQSVSAHLTAGDVEIPAPPESVRDWPIVGARLYDFWNEASVNLAATFRQIAPHLKPLAGLILTVAGSAGTGTLKFLASVVLAGFLFPAGPRLVAATRLALTKIVPQRTGDFIALAGATIRTVAQGVIGIAVVQSLLAGVGLKMADVPNAGILAFAVLVLCIVQIGAAPVFIPVIIWIWTVKDFSTALLITIYLALVGLTDNVLKPLVMGRGMSTPVLVIFIGVIGGTLAHGIIGLFVGPILLAVAWELMMAWIGEKEADSTG